MVESTLVTRVKGASVEFIGIVQSIRVFVDKFVTIFTDEIAACESEADFYKLVAQIGDDLYVGNAITEAIDYETFKFILNKGADPLLDKVFGQDWFTVLKSRAINLKAGM